MKVLLLVQGISSTDDYILNAVVKSGFDTSQYDAIETIPTEEFFRKTAPWYVKAIEKVPFAKAWTSRLNDILRFLHDQDGRIGACRLVRMTIKRYQDKGYSVDMITHSLGTIITLVCGPNKLNDNTPAISQMVKIDKLYMFASPIGMILPFGAKVREFVRRFIMNFYTIELIYVYGLKDFVSKIYDPEDQGQILSLVTIGKKEVTGVEAGHSLTNQLYLSGYNQKHK